MTCVWRLSFLFILLALVCAENESGDLPSEGFEQILKSELPSEGFEQILKDAKAIRALVGSGKRDVKEAISLFEEAASKGSAEAINNLGEIYLFGEGGLPSNSTKAIKYFQEGADLGQPDAQHNLAFLHNLGLAGMPKDEGLALLYDYFASVGGSSGARMAMGWRHLQGHGVPKSCESANKYYHQVAEKVVKDLTEEQVSVVLERARLSDERSRSSPPDEDEDVIQYYANSAENGDLVAQVAMGQLHLYGARGVAQNPERAANYFRAAAAQGDTSAMSSLGQMYVTGLGVGKNNDTAFQYFSEAAKQGDPVAQNGLGFMYLHGYGTEADYGQALKYFKKAAAQNNAEAQFNLGAMYFAGLGVEKKYATSFQYFSLAATQGHTRALYNLALMHINGLGTVRSCSIAVKLIKTVAERGESAQLLGQAHRLYLKGRVDHALLLYARLAEEGFEVAQSNSAWLLDQGQGHNTLFLPTNTTTPDVAPNVSTIARYSLAYRHFTHSAEQGNIDAYRVMGDYAYYGYLSVADYKKAARFYTLAADGRQAQAMFNLGYMHQHGIGVPQDFHLAKRYYDSALEHAAEAYVPVQLALLHLRLSNKLQQFYQWWSGAPISQPTTEGGPNQDSSIPTSRTTDSQQSASSDSVPSFLSKFSIPELPYSLEDIILLLLCLSLAVIVYIRAR